MSLEKGLSQGVMKQKPVLIGVIVLVTVAIIFFMWPFSKFNFGKASVPQAVLESFKTHEGRNPLTVSVFKDANGKVKYYQLSSGAADAFSYLFDSNGIEVLKTGGFAPVKENEEKFRELIKGLNEESL